MKLPSISTILAEARLSARRFSFTLACSILAAIISMIMVHDESVADTGFKVVLVLMLGLVLFFAAEVFLETRSFSRGQQALIKVAIVLALAGYFFYLPDLDNRGSMSEVIRYFIFNIAAHVLVSFSAWFSFSDTQAFWNFNRQLFTRFLTAALYSTVLYLGLTIALGAVNLLFKADIPGEIFADLFLLVALVFNTWFFLAGAPRVDSGQYMAEPSRGLRVFSQYILLPIVALYLLILYVYAFTTIAEMKWPEYRSTWLVAVFSAPGILALLLLFPYQFKEEFKWIKKVNRAFYILLIPLTILMLACIYKRVDAYGLTEAIYLYVACGLWLLGISIYFTFFKSNNIRLIPVTLVAVLLLSSMGPWGAFAVAERSQRGILVSLLEKNQMLDQDGYLKPARLPAELETNDEKEIRAKLVFLIDHFGRDSLANLLSEEFKDKLKQQEKDKELSTWDYRKFIFSTIGVATSENAFQFQNHYFQSRNQDQVINVRGYDYTVPISNYRHEKYDKPRAKIEQDKNFLVVSHRGKEVYRFDVVSFAAQLPREKKNSHVLPLEKLTFAVKTRGKSIKFLFSSLNVDFGKFQSALRSYNGRVLLAGFD